MENKSKYYSIPYPRTDFPIDIQRVFHSADKSVTYSYISGQRSIRGRAQLPSLDKATLYPHYHDSFEILCVTSGKMNLFIQSDYFMARPSEIYFINPYDYHGGSLTDELEEVEYLTVTCNTGVIKTLSRQYQDILTMLESGGIRLNNLIREGEEQFSVITQLVQDMIHSAEHKAFGWEMYIEGLLHCLLGTILSGIDITDREIAPRVQCEFMRKVTEYINMNIEDKISLQAISAYIGYNPKYFCRLFKRYTEQNFNEYVTAIRIERAKILLLEDIAVAYVACECGFGNSSYFSKKFKEYVGMSPNDFKAKNSPFK